jgi:uncharacterized protein YbcV (DUF1398 family)
MNDHLKSLAQKSLAAAYDGTMTFPEIIGTLIQNGFESYHVDYVRGTATYYLTDGGNVELVTPRHAAPVAKEFKATVIQAAIKEAQQQVVGYTYAGFCKKVMAAGCAGYIVSFPGKRAVYFGRTAETHVELFPQ